jgi:hypothetical protein
MAAGARSELSDAIGPELAELDLAKTLGLHELDPRRTLNRLVSDSLNGGGNGAANGNGAAAASDGRPATNSSTPAADDGAAPPQRHAAFDPDAT